MNHIHYYQFLGDDVFQPVYTEDEITSRINRVLTGSGTETELVSYNEGVNTYIKYMSHRIRYKYNFDVNCYFTNGQIFDTFNGMLLGIKKDFS